MSESQISATDKTALEKVARALDPNAWGTVDYKLPDRANDKARRATSLNKAERAIKAYLEHLESEGMVVGEERERLLGVVSAQALDEGLWFEAKTAAEAYLQQELRRLHAVIEGKAEEECALDMLRQLSQAWENRNA